MRWLVGMVCLLAVGMVCASIVPEEKKEGRKSDEQIHLIHSDVLYKNWQDPRADVLVGHVRLYHDGVFLDCDSARFYKAENSFDAFGHVKMVQGDTVTLTSDTLFYDGFVHFFIQQANNENISTQLGKDVFSLEDSITYISFLVAAVLQVRILTCKVC